MTRAAGDPRRVRLGDADRGRAQVVFARCDEFQRLIYQRGTLPGEADALFDDRPEGVAAEHKEVWGVERGDELCGVYELLWDFPGPGDAYLGLLLLVPEARGAGLGGELCAAIETQCRARGMSALLLGVVERNRAGLRFWQRHGFVEVHRRVWHEGGGDTDVLRLRKPLGR